MALPFAVLRRTLKEISLPPEPPFSHNNSRAFVRFDKTCTARGIKWKSRGVSEYSFYKLRGRETFSELVERNEIVEIKRQEIVKIKIQHLPT